MAPKRPAPAAAAASSSSSYASSSSDDEERSQEEIDSVSPKKNNPMNPPLPTPQVPKPINPSQNPPAAASDEEEEDDDDDDDESSDDKDVGDGDSKQDKGSVEEEEEEEGSSDEESDSEDEKTKNQPPDPQSKPQSQPPPKPTQEPSDSGSSDDSGSDSDSSDEAPVPAPRPSRAADPSIKPISTKPMDASPKHPSKPAAASPAPSQDRESLKRKHDAVERPEQDSHGGLKRQMFQRLWSLEDEIVLLNGLLKYRSKEGTVPSSHHDMEGFRNFIKGSLQVEVSNAQLVDKVRRLKKKFQANIARAKKNGADPKFTKPHERAAYELSKKVWGIKKISSEDADANSIESEDNEESESEMASDRKTKEEQLDSSKHEDAVKGRPHYPYLWETVTKMADEHLCGVAIRRALMMLNDSKAKLMEEKLKKLKMTELKQHLRRIDLNKETVKLIIDAVARSE